ncbi:hypothetical protein BY996DRAFT_8403510 [Phakopsora pachyrhizi]|nr:hypothetical protein BY996DRAFT_8403510 [Phakopsora pachyrhizi]
MSLTQSSCNDEPSSNTQALLDQAKRHSQAAEEAHSYPILSRLPLILVFFWPVSTVIIGLRLRELDRKIPPTMGGGDGLEAIMSGTIWGGFMNFMASLPSSNPWITSARILLLMILFPAIANLLQPAATGVMNLIKLLLRLRQLSGGLRNQKRLNSNVSGSSRRRKLFKSEFVEEDDEEEEMILRRVGAFQVVLVSIYIIVG